MTHGLLPLPIVAGLVVVFTLVIAIIQRLRPIENTNEGVVSDLSVILLAIVLTGTVVISFVAATQADLPKDPTGYDYVRAEENITDPWDTPTETRTPTTTTTTSLAGHPVSAEFRVESPDPGIEFPVVVTFELKEKGNWTELAAFQVDEGEPFTVELIGREWYRIAVTDAENTVCGPSLYQAMGANSNQTLLINDGHVKSC